MSELTPGRVAILIPVFGAQRALEASLTSLACDGETFHVFVVDDGSNPPIAVPRNLPFKVMLIRLPCNVGVTRALNEGLRCIVKHRYEYVARLDAGDLSLPGRLRAQMDFLDRHPDHALVGTCAEVVDDTGRTLYTSRPITTHDALWRALRYRNPFYHASIMIRVAVLISEGFYHERFRYGQDYEMWLRLSNHYKLANLPHPYIRHEIGKHQITAQRRYPHLGRAYMQVYHFCHLSVHAYLGVMRSILASLVPRGVRRWRRMAWVRSGGCTIRPDSP